MAVGLQRFFGEKKTFRQKSLPNSFAVEDSSTEETKCLSGLSDVVLSRNEAAQYGLSNNLTMARNSVLLSRKWRAFL